MTRSAARAVALASVLAVLAVAPAHANPLDVPVVFSWAVPSDADCASQSDIEKQVARLARRGLASTAGDQSLRILARTIESNGTWFARVTLTDQDRRPLGVREVSAHSESCRALDVPVALVVATLLDGLQAEAGAHATNAQDDAGLRDSSLGIGARVSAASGLGPQTWFGAGAVLELRLRIPIVFDVNGYLPGERVDERGRGMRHWAAHAGVHACPRLVGDRLALHLCLGGQVGGVWGESLGLTRAGRELLPLVLVGAEPTLRVRLTPSWSLQLSVAAAWAPVRPHFRWLIVDEERRWEGKPYALLVRIGVIDFLP